MLSTPNPDQQEPLEAGEDGTFDLGNPSSPPSPTKPIDIVRTPDAADDSKAPPAAAAAAESKTTCGSPPIKDDWEKVELQGADEGAALRPTENDSPPPAGGSPPAPEEPLDAFEDAVETKPPQGTETSVGGGVKEPESERSGQAAATGEPSGSRPSPSMEQPAAAAVGKATAVIAAGLANVRLPMGYDRQARLGGDGPVDSDGEEEFHDAHDSGPGMAKDAAKAREMKEIGNG